MKNRNLLTVLFLPYLTFGIYSIVWLVQTKRELNEVVGTTIPTSWLLIVPIANIYWLWKYCEAVEELSYGDKSALATFVLFVVTTLFGFGPAAMAIMQNEFNDHPEELNGTTRIRIGELEDDVTVYHIHR